MRHCNVARVWGCLSVGPLRHTRLKGWACVAAHPRACYPPPPTLIAGEHRRAPRARPGFPGPSASISPSLCCFPRAHATPAFLPFSALTPSHPKLLFFRPLQAALLTFPNFLAPPLVRFSAIAVPRIRPVVAAPTCPDPPCRIFCSQVARRVPSLFYTRTRFPAEIRATASASIPLSVASPPPLEPPPAFAVCVGPFWVGRAPPVEHQGIFLSTPRSGAQRSGAGDSDLLALLDSALRWPGGVWEERGEVDCTRGGSALQPSASRGWRAERLSRETAVRNYRSFSCFPTASKMGVALPKTLDFFFFFKFLQRCVDFCHTARGTSHDYACIRSLPSLPPFPPPHSSRSSQST